ncbi:MFS general substrate transporter [Lophium mytilinum]|uniref:MFS general substrate transporter n=1 Tax=Lophium mytilinum TaxID=390894 RepID=A0A6A6QMG5_9PEZI|nr:MFS general substrate transporter [Lophium mytilinum]
MAAPIDKAGAGISHSSETSSQAEEQYSVFSNGTRAYLTYLLGFVMITSTLSATIYFPLIPMLSSHFNVSIQAINLTVTVYAICQALSPGIFAALADMYGRRPVLLAMLAIYACASLGLALNRSSYAALISLRALQSIGGSATTPIAYGIVADVAIVSTRGKMLGPMMSTCNAISAVGPVVAGAIALSTDGYVWVFLLLLMVGVICFVLVGLTLPETARNVVGNGSESVHGIWQTWASIFHGARNGYAPPQSETSIGELVEKPTRSLLSVFGSLRIILHPDGAVILWMIASSYCIYYMFQVAIPVIFQEIYGYNSFQIGLVFLSGLIGMTIGGIIAGKLIDTNYAKEARKHNIDISHNSRTNLDSFPLERARYRHIIPFILLEITLVAGYGWAVQSHAHPAIPIILQFFICACSTLLSHTASALLVDVFPDAPSTAYAAGQITRCGLSAAAAAVIEPLGHAVGRGWFFTIFSLFTGGGCVACVLVSRWKGMAWRQKRMARSYEERSLFRPLIAPPDVAAGAEGRRRGPDAKL